VRPLRNISLDLRHLEADNIPLFTSLARGSNFSYRVIMEPVGSTIFFLASTPVRVNGPYPEVSISHEGAVSKSESARSIDVYEGDSDTTNPEPLVRNSSSQDYPAGINMLYLQLPRRLDPRIPALADKITATASSNYERIKAVENYLRTSFGY